MEVPNEYAGKVIEIFGGRGGEMIPTGAGTRGSTWVKISTRGLMGLRTRLLNATRGEATLHHRFLEYGPHRAGWAPATPIAMYTDKAAAYALNGLQPRGRLFVGPGEMCSRGMIVGEHAKDNDLVVNVARAKQRSTCAPPRRTRRSSSPHPRPSPSRRARSSTSRTRAGGDHPAEHPAAQAARQNVTARRRAASAQPSPPAPRSRSRIGQKKVRR